MPNLKMMLLQEPHPGRRERLQNAVSQFKLDLLEFCRAGVESCGRPDSHAASILDSIKRFEYCEKRVCASYRKLVDEGGKILVEDCIDYVSNVRREYSDPEVVAGRIKLFRKIMEDRGPR